MQIKSNHMWPKNYSFNFRSEVPDCRRPDCIHSRRQVYTTKFTSYTWDVTCIQTLYQLTLFNRFGNGGKGSVVGLLKVGHKKLFLLDEVIKHLIIIYLKCVFMKCFQVWSPTQVGKPNELVPLCVLDFYVAERRQRSGCGSKLFQHMLIDQRADPRWHNPVDNPQREQVVLKKTPWKIHLTIDTFSQYVMVLTIQILSLPWFDFCQIFGRWSPQCQAGLLPEEALWSSQHNSSGEDLLWSCEM